MLSAQCTVSKANGIGNGTTNNQNKFWGLHKSRA